MNFKIHIFINICYSLRPNTNYKFRIAATNDVGMSDYSAASLPIKTKAAGQYFLINNC